MTRRIVRAPPGQVNPLCPPTEMQGVCNEMPCPVDGLMGRWEEWSGCSRACGTGMQTRFRKVLREARNGGLPTGETMQHQLCNTNPCDQDCVLSDWTAWGTCSKVCNSGHRARVRKVLMPALVGGTCPLERDPERLESRPCNKHSCPDAPLPICRTPLDLVLVIDSSGSMGAQGVAAAKQFAVQIVARMQLGENATSAKIGAVTYADSARVSQVLTADRVAFTVAVSGLFWEKGSTNTGQALALAGDMMAHHGRGTQTQKSIVVITDSMPVSAYLLSTEAAQLQQRGVRISFVLLGHGVSTKAVQNWVSWPTAENVVKVPGVAALAEEKVVSQLLSNLCPILH